MAQDGSGTITEDEAAALLDSLVESGAIVEDDGTGALETSGDFERVREIYAGTYRDADDERFHGAVAEAFDLDPAEAADRVEELGVTREELVAYLSLESFLDDPPSRDELAVLAHMVADIGPGSPVPRALEEVDEGSYAAFVEDRGDVVLVVVKHNCGPCHAMEDDIDDIVAAGPDGVAFAGIDGGEAPDFRDAFDVDAAPTTLLFEGGDLEEKIRGRRSVSEFAEAFERVYG